MANYTSTANVVLSVNGKQAQKMLSTLEKDAQRLEKQLAKAATAGDKATMKKLQRELNSTNNLIKQMQGSAKTTEQVLSRLDKASPKELQKALRTLQQQLNGIERGSAAWNAHVAKIQAVKAETDNPSQNIHSLHHEYWLRGLTSIATEGNVPSAVFQRPGAALFSPTDASGNALTNGVSYTFANTFFIDNYADKLYNQYANPYYATAHNYPDYLRLAGEVPYIVRFPGARYYEFDLSSAF